MFGDDPKEKTTPLGGLQARIRLISGFLVGAARFERAAPCTPCRCATWLRYAPTAPRISYPVCRFNFGRPAPVLDSGANRGHNIGCVWRMVRTGEFGRANHLLLVAEPVDPVGRIFMAGPLDGVKIADFTEIIAGPLAGRLLAEMGADVIKIEPPWGEPWRLNQRFTATESRGFMVYNRGKRSLPLDLTKPESQEILGRLIPQVDVVLANFRPDVAAKLGVDYPTLDKLNPRLIYCEITAHGRTGPEADRPGYDMILQAMSGLMACETKLDNGVPQQIWSTPLIDTTAGFCLAWCVCGALFAREQTGKGQKVETSLLGSALALLGARFLNVEELDRETRHKALQDLEEKRASSASYQELLDASPGSRRQRHHANVYYRVYLTKDSPISVGCLSEPLRRRLLDTLDLTDIGLEPGYNPNTPEALAYAKDLEGQAEKILIKNTSAYWLELF